MRRIAVVTGAAGGVGSATVRLFREEGWYVVSLDVTDSDQFVADRTLVVDISDEGQLDAAMESLSDLGDVTALINNAAVSHSGPMAETTSEDWDRLMRINLRAVFLMTRSVIPMMADHGGAIVNVSSVHAVATTADAFIYAATKAGLLGLTRGAALDLASRGIRVNAVLPGAVDTPMLRRGASAAARVQGIADRTPLGRIAEPSEVAQAVLFLADGQRSSFITGQTLVVDGGALARLSTE